MPQSSALSVRSLTKVYFETGDGPAGGIRDASFELPDGTFFTLLGPSGCGKTTTLRCIAGLEFADKGSIRVGDDTFFDSEAGRWVPMNERGIGMVFQSYAIWPHMTVFENVAFPLRVARDRRYSSSEIREAVQTALASVSLSGFESRQATRLSGGQQQRVALARAIVRKPRLLLLDEPLSNLDATLREEMRKELKRLQRQIGVTTIYVTHDQGEALEMSDSIAILNQGRIVQVGNPQDIYFAPDEAFVASFVGATNLLEASAVAEGRDEIEVRLADGQRVRCRSRAPVAKDAPLVVSVRPETIALSDPGSLGQSTCANRLEGEVVFVGFVGNANRYSLRCGDMTLQAQTNVETRFPIGSRVAMEFPVQSSLAFAR